MVHRWRCRDCGWTTWSASQERTEREVNSHIVSRYGDRISKGSFGVEWTCAYCDEEVQTHDASEGFERYRDHLFSHNESLLESDVHVADDINGTGSILVLSELEGTGADNAQKHFLSPGDILLFVTTRPQRRIRFVQDELEELPSSMVVITSREDPLDGLAGGDPLSLPVEVVRPDGTVGLSTPGQTISRVVDRHEQMRGKISFEFDILSELITTFDLQQVFKFLHVLTARLEDANALSHFYANPDAWAESSINILDEVFDMRLTAEEAVFMSDY